MSESSDDLPAEPPETLPHDPDLRLALIHHSFSCRLDRAKLLASATASQERIEEAKRMIRELALRRVFDRFSAEQEVALRNVLDRLVPPEDLAKLPFVYQPPESPYHRDHWPPTAAAQNPDA